MIKNFIKSIFLISVAVFSVIANAAECQTASASKKDSAKGIQVTLLQHQFADGQQDLAMQVVENGQQLDAKRITYGGSTEEKCRYIPIQVLQGGDWGWHMLWQESSGLYYARMDGEAWVSTPAKQIAEVEVTLPLLQVKGEELVIVWQQAGKQWQRQSFNEGKTWRDARPSPVGQ